MVITLSPPMHGAVVYQMCALLQKASRVDNVRCNHIRCSGLMSSIYSIRKPMRRIQNGMRHMGGAGMGI